MKGEKNNFQLTIKGFGSRLILTGSESKISGQTGAESMNFSRPDPDPEKFENRIRIQAKHRIRNPES